MRDVSGMRPQDNGHNQRVGESREDREEENLLRSVPTIQQYVDDITGGQSKKYLRSFNFEKSFNTYMILNRLSEVRPDKSLELMQISYLKEASKEQIYNLLCEAFK